MKIKTVLIACAVTAGVVFGGIKIATKAYESSIKPVQVIPVANINSWFGGDDMETVYGQLVSKDGQTVERNTEYRLKKVYVQTGDAVKIGDPLLEYDMTMPMLKREMSELNKQILEMSLVRKQKELEAFKKNPNKVFEDDYESAGMDFDFDDDFTGSPNVIDDGLLLSENPGFAEDILPGDILDDTADEILDPGDAFPEDGDDIIADPDRNEQGSGQGGSYDDLIFNPDDEEPSTDDDADLIVDNEDDIGAANAELMMHVEQFLDAEHDLRHQYTENPGQLNKSSIARARTLFETYLTENPDEITGGTALITDALAEKRELRIYKLLPGLVPVFTADGFVERELEEDVKVSEVSVSLYRAYANVLFYQLMDALGDLNEVLAQVGSDPDTISLGSLKTIEPQILQAMDAYYQFEGNWKHIAAILEKLGIETEDIDFLEEAYKGSYHRYSGVNDVLADPADGVLSKLIWRLRQRDTITEPEEETEGPNLPDEPNPDDWGGDFGDLGDGGYSYTAEEIAEIIREREEDIAEVKLQIRETEIVIRKYDRILSEQIVRAKINGVVKSAGTIEGGEDYNFIVLAGEKGMYLEGSIGELKLDTLKVGDTLHGTCEETGASFTAVVTEISGYPSTGDNFFYGWGMGEENTNVSNYPFTAYIEDSSALMEGFAQYEMPKEEVEFSIYLENYYLRTDENGKSYVYVQGEDELLEKRIVRTGKTLWGSMTQVTGGLKESDLIAFPYGKHVKEGAKTIAVDYFDDTVYG